MQNRSKRINQAFRWLIWLEKIDGKNDFAEALGMQRSNVTNVLNGKSDASDRFLRNILTTFPGIFNRDWLLDGVGDMLATANGLPTFPFSPPVNQPVETETREQRQSIIDLYAGLIKESESFRREIKNELEEVKNLRAELQQSRDDFREATYRMTTYIANKTASEQHHMTAIGIAAEPDIIPSNN